MIGDTPRAFATLVRNKYADTRPSTANERDGIVLYTINTFIPLAYLIGRNDPFILCLYYFVISISPVARKAVTSPWSC